MNCCQCQGIEELFSQEYVNKELSSYRTKGPDKTTRMLAEAIKEGGVEDLTLLDIGGGLGVIQHELIKAGVKQAMSVDASSAYITAAKSEIERQGLTERVNYHHGDFVELAPIIAPADIVTLDRVICCYDDMKKLVSTSAARARKLYGLVYPRDTWWIKIALAIGNLFLRLKGSQYRSFVHPTEAVETLVNSFGFKRRDYRKTLVWQVVVYSR